MNRIVVTGGAGFIGSCFVRYVLSAYPDYMVTVLDALTYAGNLDNLAAVSTNPRFRFVHGDIRDPVVVDNVCSQADAVVNFAAESHVDRSILDPGAFIQTDIAGVFTLLEAAKKYKHGRFVHISTDEVYGSAVNRSFAETDPLVPSSPYSATKAGGELLAHAFFVTYGLPVLVTRGSNTYGPYQYPEKLIPLFTTLLIDDQPVPVYGDGLQIRDWLYVLDHAKAVDRVLHHGTPGEAYNVPGGNERTNMEIVRLMLRRLDKPESLISFVADRPGHDRRYSIDGEKLSSIGFQPTASFEECINETVDWYLANQDWWRKIKEKSDYKEFMQAWYKQRS